MVRDVEAEVSPQFSGEGADLGEIAQRSQVADQDDVGLEALDGPKISVLLRLEDAGGRDARTHSGSSQRLEARGVVAAELEIEDDGIEPVFGNNSFGDGVGDVLRLALVAQ